MVCGVFLVDILSIHSIADCLNPCDSTVSKRLAILALIPFCYSLFTTEITVLLQGKKSTYKHKKLPRAARVNKENYVQPGMGIGYIYEPDCESLVLFPLSLCVSGA